MGAAACVLRDGAARLLRMRRIFVPSSNRPHPEERPQVASRRSRRRHAAAPHGEGAAPSGRHDMSEPRPAALSAAFLIGPASATVVLVLVLPLLLLLRYSFNRFVPGQFMVEAVTIENYVKFFADPYYSRVMLVTIAVAVSSTFFCLLLGYPTAYL